MKFCENFSYKKLVCTSEVNETSIAYFDVEYLGNLFGVPDEGFDEYVKGKMKVIINQLESAQTVKKIGENYDKSSTTKHKFLSPLQKLLFNIVWRGVVPRTQKRDDVNLFDACLI